ncbi:NYN domain-containing protein [Natranaerobius thermophilus]|uniref:NYN domain-containing protein n=1 Tax=Natranaerobius thermophilus (strain ATCC BAA-1301 / DSM 18059 / JW/NM-WN-LF) TaxID=457570 RepID=B2A4C0_NATTJ|nr:NYN domain-containing protein [Natranaerobius thermophilus]ACB83774.1 protein of unknown function DUF901 [Natranaerobius thermophilus JW/NM-WN-LF]
MTDYLIVDGYNIINAWDHLKKSAEENLEISRIELIDELSEYKGILWGKIVVVFDAHSAKQKNRHTEQINGILVIYTKEGETADSLIEALVYDLVDKGNVDVATSDWQEQRVIMGKGAVRLSARDLKKLIRETKEKIRKNFIEKEEGKRNTLDNLLDQQVKEKLNILRHKK